MVRLRILALGLALVGWPAVGWAQFTLVGQDEQECGGATSCQAGTAVTAQAGDLVVLGISLRGACTTITNDGVGASDATNGAYTVNAANAYCDSNNTGAGVAIAYFINSGAASLQPTATWATSTTGYINFSVWRPTGTVTADQFNEIENGGSTSQSHGSITTTGVGLIVTASEEFTDTTETVATNFTALTNNNSRDYFQYWITTGAQTTTGAYTTGDSVGSVGAIASFLDDGGGASTPCTMTLLGVGKCDE